MHLEQAVLFVGVASLALALVVGLVAPSLRARAQDHAPDVTDHAQEAKDVTETWPAGLAPGLPELAPSAASASTSTLPPTPPPSVTPLLCRACQRRYPAGFRFCSHDGQPLATRRSGDGQMVPAAERAPDRVCATCQQTFAATARFCPFDGEPLGVEPTDADADADAEAMAGGAESDLGSPVPLDLAGHEVRQTLVQPQGRICPSCARRYRSDVTFCARDGAALVSVN